MGAGPAAGAEGFAALERVLESAVTAAIVPGGVLLCADKGITRFHRAFGARQINPQLLPASVDTVYDTASLTKAVSTSVLFMQAIAARQITLDDRVQLHLPEFRGDRKESVTVRHLLCHASGLPAHRKFYEAIPDGSRPSSALEVARAAAREPLINPPGSVSLYSDLGFILLGWLLARVTGVELDDAFRQQISGPLGLSSAAFLRVAGGPRGEDPATRADRELYLAAHPVAPTEFCPTRGRSLLAEVDDLNAFAMGGVAGHAGLFSNAADLARIAQALVSAWQGVDWAHAHAHAQIQSPAGALVRTDLIREFWRPAGIDASTWRLGWDGPSALDSQAGSRISRAAVGHLGFTGCSLWIDPPRALWIVLLTNRIHPVAREDPRFRVFRAAVHDAAIEAMDADES